MIRILHEFERCENCARIMLRIWHASSPAEPGAADLIAYAHSARPGFRESGVAKLVKQLRRKSVQKLMPILKSSIKNPWKMIPNPS